MDKIEAWISAGNKLRELRKSTGLSIYKIAREIGVSGNYISLLERGKQQPSDTVLISLCDFYKIDKSILFNLYSRVENDKLDYALSNPELRKILNKISMDKNVSREDFTEIAKDLQRVAYRLTDGEE